MPTRRRDPISMPRTFHSSVPIRHDYGIDDSITRAGFFSNAVLDDTEAAVARSRGKDYDLLRNTNSAIIDTEMHSNPRATAASMRARASSVPPKVHGRPARLQQQLNNRPKVVGGHQVAPTVIYLSSPVTPLNSVSLTPVVQSEVPWRLRAGSVSADSRAIRACSVPPRPISYHAELYEPIPATFVGTEGLRAHRPPPAILRNRAGSVTRLGTGMHRAGSLPPPRAARGGSVGPVGTEGLRAHRPPPITRLGRAQSVGRNRAPFDYEAEIEKVTASKPHPRGRLYHVGESPAKKLSYRAASEPPGFVLPSDSYPRIEVPPRVTTRHLYARRGHGAIPTAGSQSAIYNGPALSGGLHASRPPLPKQTDRKAIRTVDGFTKPKNVMSWEYRVESRLSPEDMLYTPSSFGRMRDQVRNTREKMDRHRQLLDRYLDTDMKSVTKNNTPPSSSRY